MRNSNNLGDFIVSRRTALSLTSLRLAELAGLSRGHLSRIESGQRSAQPDTLAALAAPLGVELAQLYAVAGYPVPEPMPLRPYLRHALDMPEAAIDEATVYLQKLADRYGGPKGPSVGEDEDPEIN